MYTPYKWEFNEEVAQCFDEHVRQSVFMYDEFHKSIIKMSNWFIEDNTNVLDVGTSTGELLMRLPYNPTCRYIGIDTEEGMINKAQEKLEDKYELQVGDILNYNIVNCSLITMVLVLQFIKNKDKELGIFALELNKTKNYVIAVSKEGYIGYKDTVASISDTLYIDLKPIKKNTVIVLKKLFFDTNKTTIKTLGSFFTLFISARKQIFA